MKLTDCKDTELVELAIKGHQGAYLVLYDRYKTGLMMHVSEYLAVREEAEDVVLESFQKAFSQISTYNSQYRFSTWLYRIARNTALDHLDHNARAAGSMPVNSLEELEQSLVNIVSPGGNPESEVISGQEYEKLVAAIDGLSPIYREVASMVLLDNFGYQEVADALDLPLGTVKTRVKRAKDFILRTLQENNEDQ